MMIDQFKSIDEIKDSIYLDGDDVLEAYGMDETTVGAEIGYMILYFFLVFLLT
ncbi:MAG: hypothetical protein V2I33_23710 [Kangiellaceae bacterium]|jgi:hypothetical protein|nr:hypothetical protein [Kangiellaceae bacterium]